MSTMIHLNEARPHQWMTSIPLMRVACGALHGLVLAGYPDSCQIIAPQSLIHG